MDFGALPPEINSGRMYSGAGSEPILAAAAAWDELAAQLRSTAASYSSVVAELATEWRGPSSAAMAAAAAPYATWTNATAAQAEQTAAQATAAASAYESAFAATVPPPLIAANRATLASLVATNVLGQNMPAIAATEAQYANMWAQDAAAMYGYAGQSATAAQLAPFGSPPQTTDPAGPAAQSAAVAQTAHAGLQPMSQVPSALQSMAAPAAADPLPSWLSIFIRDVLNPFGSLSPVHRGLQLYEFPSAASLPARNALVSSTLGFGLLTRGFQTGQVPAPLLPGVLYPPLVGPAEAGPGLSAASAGLGRAGMVGALSVPPTWAAATPTIRLAATVLQGAGPAAPVTAAAGAESLFGQMAAASLAGSVIGGAVPRAATRTAAREGGSKSGESMDGADAGKEGNEGKQDKKSEKLERVLADLSQKPESVQHWHTDKAHLDSLLEQLTTKPGVHAVHVSSRHKPNPVPPQPRWG